jgi:hypothetical protein
MSHVELVDRHVDRANNLFSEMVAGPLLGGHAHTAPLHLHADASPRAGGLCASTSATLAGVVGQLSHRVARLETMFYSIESQLQGFIAAGGGGHSNDYPTAVATALRPVHDVLARHEQLLTDVVGTINSLAAWRRDDDPVVGGEHGVAAKTAALADRDVQRMQQHAAADHDLAVRLARLKQLALSIDHRSHPRSRVSPAKVAVHSTPTATGEPASSSSVISTAGPSHAGFGATELFRTLDNVSGGDHRYRDHDDSSMATSAAARLLGPTSSDEESHQRHMAAQGSLLAEVRGIVRGGFMPLVPVDTSSGSSPSEHRMHHQRDAMGASPYTAASINLQTAMRQPLPQ